MNIFARSPVRPVPRRDQRRRSRLTVRRRPGHPTKGWLRAFGRTLPCAIGRTGTVMIKREGDGATPIGAMALLGGRKRRDRVRAGPLAFPLGPIAPDDGWCDALGDRNYNRPVTRPYGASHEAMWRDDRLYDVVLVMDHNVTRRMTRGGSAIFFHQARPGFPSTEGCVAVSPRDMAWLLRILRPGDVVEVRR